MSSGHANEMDSATIPRWTLKVKRAIPTFSQQVMPFQCQTGCAMPGKLTHSVSISGFFSVLPG